MTHLHSLLLLGALLAVPQPQPAATGSNVCQRTANAVLDSARSEAYGDYNLALAVGANITDADDRQEHMSEALQELREALDEAEAQYEARLSLCGRFDGAYDPDIDPDDFVKGVDNPYFPLTVGTTLIYEKYGEEGHEILTSTVTGETREIMGIECVIVSSTEEIDDDIAEETDDYFAQDKAGNVWYFGEISKDYEDGYLVSIDGSWIAGEDGAKPGIVMPAVPVVGQSFRQEFLLGVAEDVMMVKDVGVTCEIDYGTFDDCVDTIDESPNDPDEIEIKSYAPGVGLIKEYDMETGETLELIGVDR